MMHARYFVLFLVGSLVLIPAGQAPAQLISILELPEAQEELELTLEQKETSRDIVRSMRDKTILVRRALSQGLDYDQLSSAEQKEFDADFKLAQEKLDQEEEQRIKECLTAEQFVRLKQLHVQAFGAGAFLQGLVSERLNITEEQKEALRKAGKEFQEVFRNELKEEVAAGNLPTGADRLAVQQKMIKDFNKRMVEVMLQNITEEQRNLYFELRGEPIDFPIVPELR